MPLIADEMAAFLYEHIPLIPHMGVRVESADEEEVRLSPPPEPDS